MVVAAAGPPPMAPVCYHIGHPPMHPPGWLGTAGKIVSSEVEMVPGEKG